VALGTDVMPTTRRVGLRVEGRSTFSRFRGLRGELPAANRNRLSLTAGLTVAF
jgi:hypothetical protein